MAPAAKCKLGLPLALLAFGACATAPHQSSTAPRVEPTLPSPETSSYQATGVASWYGGKFHGRKTASGVRFNQNALTCAHRTLPFGSQLKVTNLANGKSVFVEVNDRGPAIKSRLVDLSKAAAKKLDFIKTGTAQVQLELIPQE